MTKDDYKSFIVKSLPGTSYRGYPLPGEKIESFIFGFNKYIVAFAFEEEKPDSLFMDIVVMFLTLKETYPTTTLHNYFEKGEEKLTQLLVLTSKIVKDVSATEKAHQEQIGNNGGEFKVDNNYINLHNQLELFFWKLSSFLDILAKLAKELYCINGLYFEVPDKYGQQKVWSKKQARFQHPFDNEYQNRLLMNVALNLCHSYRNMFSHEDSITLYMRRGESHTLLIKDGTDGLIINKLVMAAIVELKEFIDFYEDYFVSKRTKVKIIEAPFRHDKLIDMDNIPHEYFEDNDSKEEL
jgi:hypothetical protein